MSSKVVLFLVQFVLDDSGCHTKFSYCWCSLFWMIVDVIQSFLIVGQFVLDDSGCHSKFSYCWCRLFLLVVDVVPRVLVVGAASFG